MNKVAMQEIIDQMKVSSNENYRVVAKALKESVKFRLPVNGEILEIDKEKVLNVKDSYSSLIPIIKLPYPLVMLEFVIETEKHFVGTVIAAREYEDAIYFQAYVKLPNTTEWTILENMAGMTKSWSDFRVFDVNGNVTNLTELERACIQSGAFAILNLLAALNCQNVTVGEESIKIKKRFGPKKSKPKQVGEIVYKTLIIDTSTLNTSDGQESNGNGTSKKQHLRRGHIRHLKDKTIWVNSCVVGDKGKGKVEKDYKVV